jgi:osmotically-inducible protein OsmY
MSEFDHEKEARKKYKSQDYYAGYPGNNPYESDELAGRITDDQLKYSILEDLGRNNMMRTHVTIYVKEGVVILTGYVKTYAERELIGQQVLNIRQVVKVLNELQTTELEIDGPIRAS